MNEMVRNVRAATIGKKKAGLQLTMGKFKILYL